MLHFKNVGLEIEGRFLFRHLSFHFGNQKYGLLGPNGVGKTSLAQLALQETRPSEGHVAVEGTIGYLRQEEAPSALTVGEFLISLWEDENLLAQELIHEILLETRLQDLSGGQWMRVRLAKLICERHSFLIFDEPTNNLDQEGRALVCKVIANWTGGALVISHDRDLLNQMDQILELSNQGLSVYGGNFEFYWQARRSERENQEKLLVSSKRQVERKKIERQEKIQRQVKRMEQGKKKKLKGGEPRISLGRKQRIAESSLGLIHVHEENRVQKADQALDESWNEMKVDPFLRLKLDSAKVPNQKRLASVQNFNFRYPGSENFLWKKDLSFSIQGPQRVHLAGSNGSGKTTLLKLLMGQKLNGECVGEFKTVQVPSASLSQVFCHPIHATIWESLCEASRFSVAELRNELAFFGFTGDQVFKPLKVLSGGEKLRFQIAQIFLGLQIPQVLFLDEPTNHLDLQSLALLQSALKPFEGCLILVSHDQRFVEDCGITQRIEI